MNKLLLLLPASLMAFNAFAEDDVQTPIFYGEPSNMVLTIQAMDSATEIGEEPAEVNYFLQPIGDSNKYSTTGFDITLRGYTDPSRGDKPAKYIYSIKYYKYGYGNEAPEGDNNNPIGNNDNSYTVFIGENDDDISLSVCAVWPDGKNYVEWIHNFSNIVATDANVYAYLYISGNDLPKTFTYVNKFAAQTDIDRTSLTKFYTKSDTNAANISTSFLKGNSQSGLVYKSDNAFENDPEDGVYKATLDYGTGELTLTPVTDEFEVFIDEFTTFVAPFDFKLTDGVKAYTLTYNAEGGYLDAEPVEGPTVKAYTPVVLAADEIDDYKFNIVSKPKPFEPIPVEGQGKKATLADSRMEGNVLVGVNHPHWLDTYAGKADDVKNNRYTLSGHEFIINKALSTGKNYDNPITPQYTCFVELPLDIENAPQSLTIVFPEEKEDVLYIHFTDAQGKYLQTHVTVLEKQDDGTYANKVDIASGFSYFVLTDANFEETLAAFDTDSSENSSSNREWSELGEEAYVYHVAETMSTADVETEPNTVSLTKTKASELTGDFTPFSIDTTGYTYRLELDADSETLTLTNTGTPTGVGNVSVDAPYNNDSRIFNIYGQEVGRDYKGIVIQNGKKFILR